VSVEDVGAHCDAIRDGKAAMEFRSYYSGKTIIRATSPGLEGATITFTSLGGQKFIAGKTPSIKPHAYVRFTSSPANASTKPTNSIFGLNNPTLASSELPDYSARLGNDGNASTFWQPQDNETHAWWEVNLERAVTMEQTKITFPAEDNYRYKIEISNDGLHWILAVDQSNTNSTEKTRTDNFAKANSGHFLRVTFTGKPAAIAELEAFGFLTSQ